MTLDPLRAARNREIMAAHGLDALICRLPDNVLLLTGYWPVSSFAFAVVPREGPVVFIAVETERQEVPEEDAGEHQASQADQRVAGGAGALAELDERVRRDPLHPQVAAGEEDRERPRSPMADHFRRAACRRRGRAAGEQQPD